MSARRCLGMTGNHNFPSGSKFFLQRIPSINLNFRFWMSCSKVLISQGLDPFLFHRKVHTVVTAKNLSDVSVSLPLISRKSVGVTMLLTGFIFYVKIMLLKSEGPSGKPS
ncbi:hypothetical protein TNCV_880881 [Trichonephila clavipes]|nr:hypothetical protein TNCV_880881 [Trichonephila clavipes]